VSWPVALVVFGSAAALFFISFLMWTGRWRSWYRPVLTPSPLFVPLLLGGTLAMVALIYLSSLAHLRVLIDVGIAFGIAGLVLAIWIAFAEPQWALPKWMREQNRTRSRNH
jgi:hypothetical protein